MTDLMKAGGGITLGTALKRAAKPKPVHPLARTPWLDLMLRTKAISPDAVAHKAHDVVAVAAMRDMLAKRAAVPASGIDVSMIPTRLARAA